MEQEAVLTFSSTNQAITAESILLSSEIPVKVMPLPSRIYAGCGICLRVQFSVLSTVKELLQTEQVSWQSIYSRTSENRNSEYQLIEKEVSL